MNDSWVQILTLVITVAGGILTIWVKGRVENVHKELNSRLDQWRAEMKDQVAIAATAAFKMGVQQGEDQERARGASAAAVLLDTAKAAAAELLAESLVNAKNAAAVVLADALMAKAGVGTKKR